MLAHQHTGYIQHGPGYHFAVCGTCGWLAPTNRAAEEDAKRDLDRHVASTGVPVHTGGLGR